MGAAGSLPSLPVTSKLSTAGENDSIKYATSSMQGWPEEMEDAHAAILDLDGSQSTSFFGVYDGHGGGEVALYCARQFHIELVNDPDYGNNPATAMEHVFFRIDEQLQQSDEWRELANPRGYCYLMRCLRTSLCAAWPVKARYIGPQYEGSTACVAIIRGNQIIVGNVGDSRCVLSRNGQAINLSMEHKPYHRNEKARIQAAGGQVLMDMFPKVLAGQVVGTELGIYRVDGKLAMSRAIGDFQYKQNKTLPRAEQMVTCNPSIRAVNITDDTEFLIIASDGIWDVITSQQAVEFVHACLRNGMTNPRAICESLQNLCLRSEDNSAVILVQFKDGVRIGPSGEARADSDNEIVEVQAQSSRTTEIEDCFWTGLFDEEG
ncbi:probable protein phosphatase 2C 21 isoform X2 [Brachypodium distachyon]|uniref:protein-serine/threonine phosphatase n=2 Tax=Brachypodium distachyon TaxID=15368 RepID=A0A0Q3I0V7_BRADI|nr:probable protein phosphatase 2C 21 isoform X2 [Brachypodium distachyon]XP_024317506.1 probable protein phosphatase 2C 21 isoform X2 [Brachypodium distachyon]KQJ99482.1 hypothetical protein BRADI_3g43440v3 [Brachypodium distachyon]PNT68630.1 hypothetical protein BRADI_3g43440v3 [Brachypodium distachyon]|eukprot:XP_024317505.1 probable protein phosphatase 2C 21 isoform X2 [Brachypodium distachyon]